MVDRVNEIWQLVFDDVVWLCIVWLICVVVCLGLLFVLVVAVVDIFVVVSLVEFYCCIQVFNWFVGVFGVVGWDFCMVSILVGQLVDLFEVIDCRVFELIGFEVGVVVGWGWVYGYFFVVVSDGCSDLLIGLVIIGMLVWWLGQVYDQCYVFDVDFGQVYGLVVVDVVWGGGVVERDVVRAVVVELFCWCFCLGEVLVVVGNWLLVLVSCMFVLDDVVVLFVVEVCCYLFLVGVNVLVWVELLFRWVEEIATTT